MQSILINKQGRPLTAFHDGDLDIKGMFPCSYNCYVVFDSKEDAERKKQYMRESINKSKERIGAEMIEKMHKFINNLTIKEIN